MDLQLLCLGLVGVGLLGLLVYTLMKISGECDRKAQRAEDMIAFSGEITITRR